MFLVTQNLKRQQSGQRLTKKAQVMLEFTFCFIIVVIFILAFFKAFIWGGKIFVGRQKAYENTYITPYMNETWALNFYGPEQIDLVPKINRD